MARRHAVRHATRGSRTPALDVTAARERRRRARVRRLVAVLLVVAAPFVAWAAGHPVPLPALPAFDPMIVTAVVFFAALLAILVGSSFAAGRSPHVLYRPEQIDVRMDDVKGVGPVKDEVRRSIDLFLNARTFRREMGGRARRGLLFEGGPGTGKTHLAKAMAAEAGVPFLFVSATSFQSMYYGATARKIRSYFNELRKAARAEGGAIGFIEEIDAIATTRGGMAMSAHGATVAPAGSLAAGSCCGGLVGLPSVGGLAGTTTLGTAGTGVNPLTVNANGAVSEGVGGVVNELLVQMQSFDTPTTWQKMQGAVVDAVNAFLPPARQIPRPRIEPVDILLIAATNRADNLDPALLRPGRFDRRLVFEAPDKAARRELVDHFLSRKAHEPLLGTEERRDALAGITQGYTPAMLENLLDEALVNAVRRGARAMSWEDVEHARLITEVGLGQPVGYTEHEQRLIATHEAGHATVAWLVAPHRRLEILTIVKRGGALGLLAHGDREDVYTRSRTELRDLIRIAFGGQAAEEIFFGDVSTGPGSDLTYATNVAAQMVGQAGMGDTLVSFAAVQGSAFSDAGLVGRVLGDTDGRRMVERLLREQKEFVRTLLEDNRHLVEALRDALLARHELIGHEITDVLLDARHRYAQLPAVAAVPDGGPDGGPGVVDLRPLSPGRSSGV
ncbi:AAA family ATPase [Kineosporia sp. A_224]|uniref:AAA family ATPase n=1 Tax=Kineosporia sp. A_224 TaxID=1962180 RepID=UPI000B4BC177|nr:AAA family ATPase [Kineosporia sp. A_224]